MELIHLVIYITFGFIQFLNGQDEYQYTYLQMIHDLPIAARKILINGFSDDFLSSDSILTTLFDVDGKPVYPLPWYTLEHDPAKILTSAELDSCKIIHEDNFDCYLFHVIMKHVWIQQRYASNSNPNLEVPPSKLTITFLYHYCRRMAQNKKKFRFDTKAYCPNPCSNKTNYCKRLPNTKHGKCTVNPSKPFHKSGFQCTCSKGYYWSDGSNICLKKYTYYEKMAKINKCHEFRSAEISIKNGILVCTCKPQFYGEICNKRKNACVTSVDGNPPGNVACQVHVKGNKCVPGYARHLGHPYYMCKCDLSRGIRFKKYIDGIKRYIETCIPEIGKSTKNKLNKQPCSLTCQNEGTCVSLITVVNRRDTVIAKCICKPGFAGKLCGIGHQTPVPNTMTPWSLWSLCLPLCGEGRVRTRYRMSLSLTNAAEYTSGTMDGRETQVRPCRPRPCVRYRKASSRDKFIVNIQKSDEKRPEIEIITYVLGIMISSHILVAALVVQNRLIQPFLKLVTVKAEKPRAASKSQPKEKAKVPFYEPDNYEYELEEDPRYEMEKDPRYELEDPRYELEESLRYEDDEAYSPPAVNY